MEVRFPWDPVPVVTPLPPVSPSPPKRRGRRPSAPPAAPISAATAWLFHCLTISGPVEQVTAFAEAARGPGISPWRLDTVRLEEDIFHLAASQPSAIRSLTIEGCRILARQFRDRVEDRTARAATLIGRSRACLFDLHTLLPVPDAILALGPTHPEALGWMLAHWGITDGPRQIAERREATAGRRLPRGYHTIGYSFFTAQETPRQAMAELGRRWPALRFELQPRAAE